MIAPDFKALIIERIEEHIPELKDNIQPSAVDAETPIPYAVFKSSETPIRTIHGIVGSETAFEITVFHTMLPPLEDIKSRLIECLDGGTFGSSRCFYKASNGDFEWAQGEHFYSLTFKIL